MLWTKQHMHRTSSCKGPNSSSIHNAIIMPPPHVEDLQIDKTLILWWPKVLEKHTSEAHLSIRLQQSCLSFTNFKIKGSLHTHKRHNGQLNYFYPQVMTAKYYLKVTNGFPMQQMCIPFTWLQKQKKKMEKKPNRNPIQIFNLQFPFFPNAQRKQNNNNTAR